MTNKEYFAIHFCVNKSGLLFSAECNDETIMSCSFENGMADFWIIYDFKKEVPLHLAGKAKINDECVINIRPYRIELYIDGILADEEWPCGNNYLAECEITSNDCDFCVCDIKEDNAYKPDVISSFENAEGWRPEEKVFVGDCMPYVHDRKYHVLYLKDRHHHKSKWSLGAHQWEHISTSDFKEWDIHPTAVEISSPDEASICTGSWIIKDNVHYLYYTVRTCDKSPARIRRSVSTDGFHFEKDVDFSFELSDKYTKETARDPKIVVDEQGVFHMFITTSIKESSTGCLAHLKSCDLDNWTEFDEPLYVAPPESGEPECCDYFYKDGFYYLIYSLKSKGYYKYSRKPFSDWCVPEKPVIPCKYVPKAAIFNDKIIFVGYENCAEGGYAGNMTFLEAVVSENGELTYKEFD